MKMYQTKDFYLTPFTIEIAENSNYRDWFHDPDVTKHNSHGLFPYTKAQMDRFLDQLESSDDIVLAIMYKSLPGQFTNNDTIEYRHIGNISLQSINWKYRSAEFAIVIGEKDYWGKGIGFEAGKLILHHGFNKLNLHRIWTGTANTNSGMKRLAEKLDMKEEGTFRDGIFLNGQYENICCYSILDDEYTG